MRRFFLFFLATLTYVAAAWADNKQPYTIIFNGDTITQIFVYSPGERSGLHAAYYTDANTWEEIGQLCASDYGQWGAEKRMYDPYVIHAEDGTWRAVWSVNNDAPCFAAAYSEDLITWRPQDYPHMSVRGCRKPILFEMNGGMFDIYFKSDKGTRYVQASHDFRSFKEAEESSNIGEEAWLKDTATVNGKQYEGNMFDVPLLQLNYMLQWFEALEQENIKNSETMTKDGELLAGLPSKVNATLTVNSAEQKSISDKLIGVFFEDISYAADGGLYAELIQNRDFEYQKGEGRGDSWGPMYAWSLKNKWIDTKEPLSEKNPHYAVLDYDTLVNYGWDGISVKAGERYNFSMYTKKCSIYKKGVVRVQLISDGKVIAKQNIKIDNDGWTRLEAVLVPKSDATKAELQIVNMTKGALVGIDMVSLMPQDTYKGHGLRHDLAETIAALHPKFVRFPGGCMSHGDGIDNIYHWNQTIGPWQDRTPAPNIWHYHQTRGLGFFEYFQFCEDIGAEPLPVLAAGVPCQNSARNAEGFGGQQGGIPMEQMQAYCQEFIDLIEWANGDPNTNKWARMRAEAGHPAPFNLRYIGVGNEDLISTDFEVRYEMICRAIKEKYPQITVCGTVGPFHYPSSDYIEGWQFAKQHQDIIDMVDEHYYESTGWFMHNQDYYDDYDRQGPKVYIGEYASRTRTHESAVAEALFLCNVERNGDIVEMTSYAPLLAKEGHHNWNPDMIYFDNENVTLTPSYHTQRLFGTYSGNTYTPSVIKLNLDETEFAGKDINYRVAASLVSDSNTGKKYLRLVNALPSALTVNVEGVNIPAQPQYEGFCGKPGDKQITIEKENSDNRQLIIEGNAVKIPAYSVYIICI